MSGNRNRTPIQQANSRKSSITNLLGQLWDRKDNDGNKLSSSQYAKMFKTLRKLALHD